MKGSSFLFVVFALVFALLSHQVLADCSGAKNVVDGQNPSCDPGCVWISNPVHDEAAPGDFCDYKQRENNYACKHTEYRSCDCIDTICWNQPDNFQSFCECRKDPESCGKGCDGQTTICAAKMQERDVDSTCKSSDKPCNYATGPGNPANGPCDVLDCHKQFTCTACEVGKWSSSGQTSCTDCVPGKYSSISMSQSESGCSECGAGTYTDVGGQYQCKECEFGTYQDETGKEACKVCPAGKFQDEKGKDNCEACPDGKFISDDGVSAAAHVNEQSCTLCPDGHYNDGTSAVGECTKCPPGKKSNGDKDSCDSCSGGKFSGEGWHFCAQCSSGKYSEGDAAECTNAPDGAYAVGDNQDEYTVCGAGEWSEGTTSSGPTSCSKCEAGKYLSDNAKENAALHNSADKCLPCPSGQHTTDQGSATCEACPSGKYQSGSDFTDCYQCNAGKYTDTTTGHTSCDICGAGKYSNANTAGSCADCQPGKYIADAASDFTKHATETSCIECAEDYYNNLAGQSSCTACEGGSTQGETGATECGSCLQGTTPCIGTDATSCDAQSSDCTWTGTTCSGCAPCVAGKYSNSKTGFLCTDCEPGRYGTAGGMGIIPAGSADDFTVCTRCSSGKISPAGASAESQCVDCAAGTYALYGDTTCTNCDAGTYSPAGSNDKADCEFCTPGRYSLAGSGGTSVETGCTSCEVGKAQNLPGQSECVQCLNGQYSPKAEADEISDYSTCGLCPGGTTSVQPTTFAVVLSAGSGVGACTQCPDGKSSNEGEDVCYKVATEFDTCEVYDTPEGFQKKVKNECTYLYAGHWTTKDEGVASPFGASCKSYSVCGSEHQKDSLDAFKRDEYFVVCDECADGYEPAASIPELITGWDGDITGLPVKSLENCQGQDKPTVCYKKESLKQCIETSDAALLESPKADIDCEYYFQGGWISKDPANTSPFGTTCGNYTICGFDQTASVSEEFPPGSGQMVNLLPKDTYKIMCDNCFDRYSEERPNGYIKGLTAKEDVFTEVPEGGNSLSSRGVCTYNAAQTKPGICYDSSNGFNSCPTFPTAESNPFEKFLPGSMFGQECKYMYNDAWREVDSGEYSQFNTTCKKYELCAVDEGTTTTTYKVACAECASNYLPALPAKSTGIGSQDMGTCTNAYYPSMCYSHVNPEIQGADWQTCPYSPYQDIKCKYWLDGEWIEKSSGQASPWQGQCGAFKVCDSDIEGDIETDTYHLFCTRCAANYFPKRLEKPEGVDAVGQCGDGDFTKDLRSMCEIMPTPSPTPVPTSSYRPPENPTDGGGGDDGDETAEDDYVPPNSDGTEEDEFKKPDSLTDKIKAVVGGEQSANFVIGGAIVLCLLCGACIMKSGCKCCGSSVEYDTDDEEDEYGFEDDETRDSEYTTNSEYTSGSQYDESSKYSRSSSSQSQFEQYDNPMRGAKEKVSNFRPR